MEHTDERALSTRPMGGMPAPETWRTMLTMAQTLVESGLLPAHIKTPQAAVAVIQKGLELGVPPMHALSNIVVINGKPTASAELMLALIYRDHGPQALRWLETSDQVARARYRRRGVAGDDTFAYTLEDAKRAGLTGGNWAKYPSSMLRARCVSAIARMAFPDSIGGMYTPEELGAPVVVDSATGEILYDTRPPADEPERQDDMPASDDEPSGSDDDDDSRERLLAQLHDITDRRDLAALRMQLTPALRQDDEFMRIYRQEWSRITGKPAPEPALAAAAHRA